MQPSPRKRRVTSLRGRTPLPTWMQDRATLEQIRRRKLLDMGIPANRILSPGTQRLARVVEGAFQDLEQRLTDAAQDPIPF